VLLNKETYRTLLLSSPWVTVLWYHWLCEIYYN